MSTVMIYQPAAAAPFVRPWPVAVNVDGIDTTLLALLTAESGRGATGGRATLEWTGASADFGDARRLAVRGARVRARIAQSAASGSAGNWPLFDGNLVAVRVEFDGERRRVLLDAIDGLQHCYAGTAVVGQMAAGAGGRVTNLGDAPFLLNPAGQPNRSQSPAVISGRPTYVFEQRPERAAFWSTADAVNYLLAAYLARDRSIALPSAQRIAMLCGGACPRNLDLTGRGLLDALAALAELAGADFAIEPLTTIPLGSLWQMRRFARSGDRLVVFSRQRAGQTVDPLATNVWAGSLRFDHDSARHVWGALGDAERVQSTFSLLAGWDSSLEGQSHRDYSRSNADFANVRDVYRRWVLNEAGDWTDEPFNAGPPADLSGVFGTLNYLPRRRRFQPRLSSGGRSAGVLVEVNYDSGENWELYPGRVEVLADEAGVWFADDQLPPDFWQAATEGTLAVRVTASLDSDRRVRAELAGPVYADGRRTVQHFVQLPGHYRRQWVAAGSASLGGAKASGGGIDDGPALAAALAQAAGRDRGSSARGRLVLPWMSIAYQVGDRVAGVSGQGLSFAAGDGLTASEPQVQTIRHELGEQWTTTLELA